MTKSSPLKIVHLSKVEVLLIEENIVENVVLENVMLEASDVIELKQTNLEITEGKPYCVLLNTGFLSGITKEAREEAAEHTTSINTVAMAVFAQSTGHQLVGNFYLNVNKPTVPMKLFSKREKALEWLHEQLKNFRP